MTLLAIADASTVLQTCCPAGGLCEPAQGSNGLSRKMSINVDTLKPHANDFHVAHLVSWSHHINAHEVCRKRLQAEELSAQLPLIRSKYLQDFE